MARYQPLSANQEASSYPSTSYPPHPNPINLEYNQPAPGQVNQQFAFSTTLRKATSDDPYQNNQSSNISTAYPSQIDPRNLSSSNPIQSTNPSINQISASSIYTHFSISSTLRKFSPPTNSSQTDQEFLTSGLPTACVQDARIRAGGPNEFKVKTSDDALQKFLQQFKEPLILLLLGSSAVSLLIGEIDDAVSIALAVVVVITVGFVQEQRSEKSLEALNKLVPHYCHLIRDGTHSTILANELVPGDVVTFSTGDRIPADIRLVQAVELEIDESTLTGEIKPKKKNCEIVGEELRLNESTREFDFDSERIEGTGINERENIGFMGTLVKSGYGKGIVISTGSNTEFGLIFSMISEVEEKRTSLQLSMDSLAQKLSFLSFAIIGMICLIGILQKRPILEMFTIGVSLAVAAIPEGLPIVVTVTLALGVLRMSNKKAIVKKLPTVETLGSVSVLCSDKTGTLTSNVMAVVKLFTIEDGVLDLSNDKNIPHNPSRSLSRNLLVGNLCNHSHRNESGQNVGQATDVSMMNVLKAFGFQDKRPYFKKTNEIPFDSEKKFMAITGTLSNNVGNHLIDSDSSNLPEKEMSFFKGSLESILAKCSKYVGNDFENPVLDEKRKGEIIKTSNSFSEKGLRVLATACGDSSASSSLSFCGLQALQDPPRPGVYETVSKLQSGGIQVVMITGDSESTAISIARQLGILRGSEAVLNGSQIDQMSERQLRERIKNVSVFARTTPRHKMNIINAFQANGDVVAMTGDGVNDAPALKMADIGISMGKGATDVAKEAADVILVDDNFSTILPAIEEGKGIFLNIQNFLTFQLSTAIAALTLITLSTAFKLKLPLNPMQILFINILMDGPPSQSLGVDPVDPTIMKKPPRRKFQPVINTRLLYRVAFSASIIVIGTLYVYTNNLNLGQADRRDQTMTFTCFVFLDLTSAIQNRGISTAISGNKMLLYTCSASLFAQILLIYFPPLQGIFQTTGLDLKDLFTLVFLAMISFALHEARRSYERKLNEESENSWQDVL